MSKIKEIYAALKTIILKQRVSKTIMILNIHINIVATIIKMCNILNSRGRVSLSTFVPIFMQYTNR